MELLAKTLAIGQLVTDGREDGGYDCPALLAHNSFIPRKPI